MGKWKPRTWGTAEIDALKNIQAKAHEVDPVVEQILQGLMWLQEKTCGGVKLISSRGKIIAVVESCSVSYFQKMKVNAHFPEWCEFAFVYANRNEGELVRIEIYFGNEGLRLKEYDLMTGWGKFNGETTETVESAPF